MKSCYWSNLIYLRESNTISKTQYISLTYKALQWTKCFLVHYFIYESALKLHSVPINSSWKIHQIFKKSNTVFKDTVPQVKQLVKSNIFSVLLFLQHLDRQKTYWTVLYLKTFLEKDFIHFHFKKHCHRWRRTRNCHS